MKLKKALHLLFLQTEKIGKIEEGKKAMVWYVDMFIRKIWIKDEQKKQECQVF